MLPTPTHYFENAAGRLGAHPAGFAVVTWRKGPRRLDDFKAVLAHLDQLLRLHRWNKLLADQRELMPFTEDERTWVVAEWLPQAVGNGPYRYAAVLPPLDVFARLASKSVASESREKLLTYQFCETEAEAMRWLQQR